MFRNNQKTSSNVKRLSALWDLPIQYPSNPYENVRKPVHTKEFNFSTYNCEIKTENSNLQSSHKSISSVSWKHCSDDSFLIYSNDFGEEEIDIIGRHIREFGEMIYEKGYFLLARKEVNRDFSIYLLSFDDEHADLSTTIEAIETLIETKRKEEEDLMKSSDVKLTCQITKVSRELEELHKKFDDMKNEQNNEFKNNYLLKPQESCGNYERVIKQNRPNYEMKHEVKRPKVVFKGYESSGESLGSTSNDSSESWNHPVKQLYENGRKTEMFEAKSYSKREEKPKASVPPSINMYSTPIHSNNNKVYQSETPKMTVTKTIFPQQPQQRMTSFKKFPNSYFTSNSSQINDFFNQKNLNFIRKSDYIMEKLCEIMSERVEKDDLSPPFEDFYLMSTKKDVLNKYFDILQKDLKKNRDIGEEFERIGLWFSCNWKYFLDLPEEDEKEVKKSEFRWKFGMENTIGTVDFIEYQWKSKKYYLAFAICNDRIVNWCQCERKEKIIETLHKDLKHTFEWSKNEKFATNLNVSTEYSDYFIETSDKEFQRINNRKVVDWMKNNFGCLKQDIRLINLDFFSFFPSLYNSSLLFLQEWIHL